MPLTPFTFSGRYTTKENSTRSVTERCIVPGGGGGGVLFRIIDNRAIVGHSVPQFMTLFHTETCDFPHPFSHPASRGDGEEWKKETNWEERVRDAWYKNPLLFISANPGVGKFLIG